MAVESRGAVPADDSVISLCPVGTLVVKDGTCVGITPDALRVDEDGISVTWVEYFEEPPPAIQSAATELKKSRKPTKSGALARARVSRIVEVAQKLKRTFDVDHTPIDDNDAHASITGCPDSQPVKLALTRAFREFTPNKDVPGFLA
jgi:hypothetical protein